MRDIPKDIRELLNFSKNINRYRFVEKDPHDMKNFLRLKRSLMFHAKNFYGGYRDIRSFMWNTLTSENYRTRKSDDKNASIDLYMTPDALVIAYKNNHYLDSQVKEQYENRIIEGSPTCTFSDKVLIEGNTLFYGVRVNTGKFLKENYRIRHKKS